MTDFRQFPCITFGGESQALAHRALAVANTIFDIALDSGMLEVPDRQACALALRYAKSPTPLMVAKVGYTFPDDQFRVGCFALAPEKIDRAMKNEDFSSYVTRDGVTKWGGGIVLKLKDILWRWGIAISGLREHEDEAIAVITAMYTFSIPFSDNNITEILEASDNAEYTRKLLDQVIVTIGAPY